MRIYDPMFECFYYHFAWHNNNNKLITLRTSLFVYLRTSLPARLLGMSARLLGMSARLLGMSARLLGMSARLLGMSARFAA